MNTSWTETSWEAYWTGLQTQVLAARNQRQGTAMTNADPVLADMLTDCMQTAAAEKDRVDAFFRLIAQKSTDPYARSLANTALRGDPVPVKPERADDLDRPAA